MWFSLWIKQTRSWLHPDCGTFIALALGIISVVYARFGELRASRLFSGFQVTFSGYLGIWKGEAKLTPDWLSWGCRASGTLQKLIAAGLCHSYIFMGLREGFPTPFSSASAVQEARWLFGGWVSWHTPQSFSPAGWLFPVADAGLWLKGISSERIVRSRGLSNAICIMRNHPCLAYLIRVENNWGYEICTRGLWPQHFENKNARWLFMLLFSFMQIGWW